MGQFRNAICLLVLSTLLSGCSFFGIYESEFKCPATYNGRCISVPGAHDLALKGEDGEQFDPDVPKKKKEGNKDDSKGLPETKKADPEDVAHTSYKESLFKRFNGLLNEPVAPMVAPPQVMRVLLLPYKGEGNELFMLRHVYFFVDEPKWVLGDSLLAIEEE